MTNLNPPTEDLTLTTNSLAEYLDYMCAVSELTLDLAEKRSRANGNVVAMRARVQQVRGALTSARRGK